MKMRHQLQQTVFNVEPIKNVVGVGGTAAYQIEISAGPALGMVGAVSVPAYADIVNDPIFTQNSVIAKTLSWFGRTLATPKF